MPPLALLFPLILGALAIFSLVVSIIQAFKPPSPAKVSFGYSGDTGGSPRYGQFGALDNTISNDLAVPIIYGRLKIGGNLIWQSEPSTTVHQIIALCEGEVVCIDDVRANDLLIENGEEAPGCDVTKYYGTTTQDVDPNIPATNTDGLTLKRVMYLHNLAYLMVKLVASEQLNGGNPTITSKITGMKVEVFSGGIWKTTKQFSRNPAAIIRDFILNDRYGMGIPKANVDDASFGVVYNYCEEIIAT